MNYTFSYQTVFINDYCEKYHICLEWDAYERLGFSAILQYETYPLVFETEKDAEIYAKYFLKEEDEFKYSIEKAEYTGIVTVCTVENLKDKMEIVKNIMKAYNYEKELGKYEIYYSSGDITIEFKDGTIIYYDTETNKTSYFTQGIKNHDLEHAAALVTIMRAIDTAMAK